MDIVPLTSSQQNKVDQLVADRKLSHVTADVQRASRFMRNAQDSIADIPNVTKAQNKYNLAYDACHDIGEALLAAYGYRTVSGIGQHEALGRFLQALLDTPPGSATAQRFDNLRRARNQQRYQARPVGAADAELAATTAADLFSATHDRGLAP